MTPLDLRAARIKAGLSASQAAKLVFRVERQWFRWESGEQTIPESVRILFPARVAALEGRFQDAIDALSDGF